MEQFEKASKHGQILFGWGWFGIFCYGIWFGFNILLCLELVKKFLVWCGGAGVHWSWVFLLGGEW